MHLIKWAFSPRSISSS